MAAANVTSACETAAWLTCLLLRSMHAYADESISRAENRSLCRVSNPPAQRPCSIRSHLDIHCKALPTLDRQACHTRLSRGMSCSRKLPDSTPHPSATRAHPLPAPARASTPAPQLLPGTTADDFPPLGTVSPQKAGATRGGAASSHTSPVPCSQGAGQNAGASPALGHDGRLAPKQAYC